MPDLSALIARLEAATEDQLSDAEWLLETRTAIADACFQTVKGGDEPQWWFAGFWGWETLDRAPNWLFSIDAALTLVPRGWVIDHMAHDASGRLGEMKAIGATAEISNGLDTHQGQAPNLAIALVIASLRARASLKEEG